MTTLVIILALVLIFYMLYQRLRLPPYPSHKSKEFVSRSKLGPVAHRAGMPENTLAGIRQAKKEGASGVEVDLSFTKDGVPVLLHDMSVDRTSNGSGKVSQLTFQQVRELDFGCKFGSDYAGERIPTLQEALSLCEELDLLIYLEIKIQPRRAVVVITDCLRKSPSLYQRLAVVSFFPHALYELRKTDLQINCGLVLVDKVLALHPDGRLEGKPAWRMFLAPYMDILVKLSVRTWVLSFLGIKMLLPNKEQVLNGGFGAPSRWEDLDVSVVTWTVNRREEKFVMENELKMAYLTDCVHPDSTAPEQFKFNT